MKDLRITRDAEADILEIWTYLCQFNENTADRVTDEISDNYDTIHEFPLVGRARNDLGMNFRILPVGMYNIIYQITEARIYILRVLHSSRDLAGIFPQEN